MRRYTVDAEPEEPHISHVEHDSRGWYWWCEATDCFASDRARYTSENEAIVAAVWHSQNPG